MKWRLTLAQRIQLQIGLAIAVVIVAVTGVGYLQTVNSMRDEALSNLQSSTRTRATLESGRFIEAQQNTVAVRDEYLHRLNALGQQDPKAPFDAWFVRYADGLIRVRPERDDHRRLPSMYIRAPIGVDAQLRREVVTAFDLMREWGPVQTLRYFSTYIDLPGKALIMYSPSVNWGKEADKATNNFDYPPVQNSAPDKNPQRKTLWTDVYFDDKAQTWMLSVITPIDQTRWVGTASQDIAVEDLIRRTTNEYSPGTYNLVMDRQGKLVAHPSLMEKIRKSAGNLDIASLGDARLADIYKLAQQSTGDVTVQQTSDGNSYLGIARIQGPDWYFVTVYPTALLEARGLTSARAILLAGMAGLVLEIALLALILRRQVAIPLKALDAATQAVAKGNMDIDIAQRGKGELGILADRFLDMLKRLRERDASLVRSEAFKDTLLRNIPDLVFVKDRDGAFLVVNRAFEKVYGRSATEVLGKTDFDFIEPDQAQYFAERDQEAMLAIKPVVSEAWQKNHLTGEENLFETIKTPVLGADGALSGMLGISRDITARRKSEDALQALNQDLENRVKARTLALEHTNAELQSAMHGLRTAQDELVQREKLASLGRMVAGLAHELNTPIGNALTIGTAMADHARNIQREFDGGALKKSVLANFLRDNVEAAEVMERALGHAAELIASFKQVSADRLSEQRREFDLASTVEEILATLRPGFRATPYQLISLVDAGIAMDSYPGLLTQVISNLATNAKLHAFDGRLEGTVTIHGESQGDKIMMTFSDDGHGVAQSIRARIFDPFFTTRMGRGGTGLGLSIVHSLVTHGLGGSIHIEPGSMQGTCFVMVFPRIAPHHPSTPLDTAPLGWTG